MIDEQSSAIGHEYASDSSAIGAGLLRLMTKLHNNVGVAHVDQRISYDMTYAIYRLCYVIRVIGSFDFRL